MSPWWTFFSALFSLKLNCYYQTFFSLVYFPFFRNTHYILNQLLCKDELHCNECPFQSTLQPFNQWMARFFPFKVSFNDGLWSLLSTWQRCSDWKLLFTITHFVLGMVSSTCTSSNIRSWSRSWISIPLPHREISSACWKVPVNIYIAQSLMKSTWTTKGATTQNIQHYIVWAWAPAGCCCTTAHEKWRWRSL